MQTATQDTPRSTFVTVLAWVVMAAVGMGLVMSVLKNLVIPLVLPPEATGAVSATAGAFGDFHWSIALRHVAQILLFIAALGLLRRWSWARPLFITLMGLGIAWNLARVVFRELLMAEVQTLLAPLQGPGGAQSADLAMFQNTLVTVLVVATLAACVLQAWLIKRLMAPAVVAEFRG